MKIIQVIDVSMSSDFEFIELSLSIDNKKVFLIACYRPPSCDSESFLDYLTDKVRANKPRFDEVIVVGDLNFDMLSEPQNELHDVCENLGLNNTVKKGTRLNERSSSSILLDVILSLWLKFFIISEVFQFSRSNYDLVISIFDFRTSLVKPGSFVSRCLSSGLMRLLAERISSYPFGTLLPLMKLN